MIYKQRRTDKIDNSLNDLVRSCGVQVMDLDLVFYSKKTWQISLIIEKKHNSLTDGNDAIVNLRENSIHMQKQDIGEKVPYAVVVTYTKENEQPYPMIFMIPQNQKCWDKLYEFHQTKSLQLTHFWMSPRFFAQFVWFCTYGQEPIPTEVAEEHDKLSGEQVAYLLPRIVCNEWNQPCACCYCGLTSANNKASNVIDFMM